MNDNNYAVLLCGGNGDIVTLYESMTEAEARARYAAEVAKQGAAVNVAGWSDCDGAWRRLCFFELVNIDRDNNGFITDIDTLETSDYYWMN